jgi:hypothetical protein
VDVVDLINQAVVSARGPQNLICTLRSRRSSSPSPDDFMSGINLLVVCRRSGGGQGRHGVRAAGRWRRSGNPPAVRRQTANLERTAKDLVRGASFDNNIICTDERKSSPLPVSSSELKRLMLRQPAVEVRAASCAGWERWC